MVLIAFPTRDSKNFIGADILISVAFPATICSSRQHPKSNLFIWLQDDMPVQAFDCTYDFMQTSFLRSNGGSITAQSAAHAYKSYENAVTRSIFCNHSEVEEYIIIRSSTTSPSSTDAKFHDNCVHLPLITKTGEPGKRSGLNWGQRNKRNKNEAYIPLPSRIAKSGFFPLNKQHFLVVTDDHHTLQLRVEQQNNKAITTPASNAQLGEYFRNRLRTGEWCICAYQRPEGIWTDGCDFLQNR